VGKYISETGGEFTVRLEDGKVEITVGMPNDSAVIDLSDGAVTSASDGSDKASEPEESNRSPVAGN
jgi:hypothetical protein